MISIIVPTLNEEKLLEGMLRQFTPDLIDRFNIELIVSDGGSSDDTLSIAKEYAHKVIEGSELVTSRYNEAKPRTFRGRQTISLGRNMGAQQADGTILVFLNADTLIKDIETFFTRVLEEIEPDDVAALTCSVEIYPQESKRIDKWFHGFYNRLFHLMNTVGMGMGRGECHIMKRDVFRKVNGYSPHIAAGEDYDMFRRVKKAGKVKFLKDLVVYESPRRYRRYGYLYVTASWFVNFLSVFFLRRSILTEWKPVR